MYKAEQLAHNIRILIENHSFTAHQKLPSLRDQAADSGLSLMTVMNAYQSLEAQGLIYAKEKSGYFVSPQQDDLPLSATTRVALHEDVSINSLVFEYLKSIQSSKMIALGSAFPADDLVSNKKLIQIMAQLAREPSSYTQNETLPPGKLALRQLIAQRYHMHGVPAHPDDIVITSGCLDALNLALQAVAKASDYIILQQHIFYGAWQAAERLGLKVITLPEHPIYGFDLEAFTQILEQYPIKVCWLMLNSHNPIGFNVSHEIKQKIATLIHEYQVYLIEDDVYEELYFAQQRPLPMKYFDQGNWVLHCSSFSKTLGASFRLGWVHAGIFSAKIQHLQLMSTISANSLLQNALVEFISKHHYEKHLRQLRKNLEKQKKIFFKYLEQNLPKGCDIFYYHSGYFLWIKLPAHIDSMSIYETLIQQHISVAPSRLFCIFSEQRQGLRLNCSFTWNEQIKQALDLMINSIRLHIDSREVHLST